MEKMSDSVVMGDTVEESGECVRHSLMLDGAFLRTKVRWTFVARGVNIRSLT